MADTVRGWYVAGVNHSNAPTSCEHLERDFAFVDVNYSDLKKIQKWEHLFRGRPPEVPAGWTLLGELAKTSRGIATGANNFFLVSKQRTIEFHIPASSILPCVGRAKDVAHYEFTSKDFSSITDQGAKTQLLNFPEVLSDTEATYVAEGEASGFHKRYLTANRSPWYVMERREIAPIWAAVFVRGAVKFIYNSARVRSLTNFHCIYPRRVNETFYRALVFCLNMPAVRSRSAPHSREYGGGLTKFEPNDLLAIPVPDLRLLSSKTLDTLARHMTKLDDASRQGTTSDKFPPEWDALVVDAGREASRNHQLSNSAKVAAPSSLIFPPLGLA